MTRSTITRKGHTTSASFGSPGFCPVATLLGCLGTAGLALVGGLRCNVSRVFAYKLKEQRTCGLTVDLPTVRYGSLSDTTRSSIYKGNTYSLAATFSHCRRSLICTIHSHGWAGLRIGRPAGLFGREIRLMGSLLFATPRHLRS